MVSRKYCSHPQSHLIVPGFVFILLKRFYRCLGFADIGPDPEAFSGNHLC